MSRIAELAARRAAIVERSSLQRARMIECGLVFAQSMTGVERGVRIVRKLASKPLLLVLGAGAGAGALFLFRPRRILALASQGLFVAGLVQRTLRFVAERKARRAAARAIPAPAS